MLTKFKLYSPKISINQADKKDLVYLIPQNGEAISVFKLLLRINGGELKTVIDKFEDETRCEVRLPFDSKTVKHFANWLLKPSISLTKEKTHVTLKDVKLWQNLILFAQNYNIVALFEQLKLQTKSFCTMLRKSSKFPVMKKSGAEIFCKVIIFGMTHQCPDIIAECLKIINYLDLKSVSINLTKIDCDCLCCEKWGKL